MKGMIAVLLALAFSLTAASAQANPKAASDLSSMLAPPDAVTQATGKPAASPPTMSGAPAMKGPAMTGPVMSAPAVARKVNFTDLAAATAFAQRGPAVLFFTASWCPTCQAALKDLDENGARLAKDITVILVDYDSSAALQAKFSVKSQHTFVQIDARGNKIASWNGGGVDAINGMVKR
jgi:thiol-disulfide isomerase/thioredoxin